MKIHKLLYDPENTREQQITKRISEIVYYTKNQKECMNWLAMWY